MLAQEFQRTLDEPMLSVMMFFDGSHERGAIG
jgi:hypothetical protein